VSHSSALPGRPHRVLAALCTVLALLTFVAPAPAVMAEEPANPAAEAPAPAISVTFEGTNAIGFSITPRFSGPLPAGTIQYEYLRDGVVIQRSVRADRGLTAEDFGKRLEFRASLIVDGQEPVVVASGTTEPVLGRIYWHPFADGQPIVGRTSYFSPYGLTVPASETTPTATYTWYRDGQPIDGATGRTYPVTEADLGTNITGTVEFSAPGYLTIKTYDTFGTVIRGSLQLTTDPQLTWTTSAPNTLTAGCVLHVSSPAVLPADPAGLTYEYQWYSTTGYTPTAIPGATGPTYTVRAEDSTNMLFAEVRPVAPGYDSHLALRRTTWSPVVQGRFTATAAPTIKGTVAARQLLTAVPGAAPSPAADSISYLWYRDGQWITDVSTDPTYRLIPEDGGHKITVKAFYNKANYIQAASPTSAAVTPPGYFTTGPAWIVGTAAVGYTVSARTSYTSPSPTTALFQWLRDGKPIAGATATSYRLAAADQWHSITFRVTFKRAGTVNATVTSRAIRPQAVFTKLPTPVVRGTFTAGQVLRASTALPYPAPTSVIWQWQREGRPIAGATASTYRLTANDRDKFIRVVVTFKRANYLNTARTSASRWVP
jgi:hypothetical protein